MNRSQPIRQWIIGLAAALLLAAPGFAEEQTEPVTIVRETVDRVIEILASEELSDAQRRQQIEEIAYQRFDFDTISRLVVARRWKGFTPEQREQFVEQFKLLLSSNYGSRITRYEQQKVAILGQRAEKNGDVTVMTRIEGGSADGIEVNYRLRKRDGPWMVIDVIIEGISLVSSYRSQFTEVLSRGGPEELLKQLREKNAEKAAAAT
jgi:phospholipid transport system substrate-binding protein